MGWLQTILPLRGKKKKHYDEFSQFLEGDKLRKVKQFLKQNKVGVYYNFIQNSFVKGFNYPQLNILVEDRRISTYLRDINRLVEEAANEISFQSFAKNSKKIMEIIAPHLIGFEEIKKACFWQLFGKERFHILLLGDPGTGKTDILRAIDSLSPISSFGLGSGTSGVGLAASKKGKEIVQGLLPRANNGICCIDELNLMQKKDRAALLNAMEKGFITYDKASTHIKMQARARVLATANPKGDRFIGKKIDTYRKQLPFDEALLSRFHLVFLVNRPDKEQLLKITRHIIQSQKMKVKLEDISFVKKYVEYALKQNVEFDKKFEELITNFIAKLKEDENQFLVELSPRIVHGIINMAKASARAELRDKVEKKDVVDVLKMIKKSIYF